jgi:D-alanyl-lipoteichoic acid acyltransferase DltB (MBOAT superfamily)
MAWGLFKKVVIADRLSIIVNAVYDNPHQYNSLSLLIATVFFSFQIFCDFSGYSDMAIGAARIMGFKLMTNFNKPYHASSIAEFWKRWHISLSTWFKDYLYISLGGNRVSIPRWYLNLFIVFIVSGLWHGANWTFIIWGALHGFYMVASLATAKIRHRFGNRLQHDQLRGLSILLTYGLVTFAWIFFRAKNSATAVYIATHLFTGIPELLQKIAAHQTILEYLDVSKSDLVISVLLIALLEAVHYFQSKQNISSYFLQRPAYVRWSVYYGYILAILFLGVFGDLQFIYFQF